MKTIGILGGLGPESTCEYYRYITRKYYETFGDYSYPEIIIYSVRFSKFIDCGYEAADEVKKAIENLHRAGADFVVAACNTIHIVYKEVSGDIPIPWVSIMDTVAEQIKKEQIVKVGLLGTIFTMKEDFYPRALDMYGIETITPAGEAQKRINDIIYEELVTGIVKDDSKRFVLECIEDLRENGAGGIVLGCTELPFLIQQKDTSLPVFDSTAIHAQKALDLALENAV
ncbi:MAG: amino acid racemase [Candidatus Latescibacteria bacterium]|jgi:aspartate racemase|nr:amino acid racemase [Candidatus Latescibacterota bacterium]